MDMKMQVEPENYQQGKQILGIPNIGYFAEQGKSAGSARQRLSQRKN
jgi:hypothetical protein